MDNIINLIDDYLEISKKLDESNKLYSKDFFNNWLNKKSNKEFKDKFVNQITKITEKMDELKKLIKSKIDSYLFDNKINFIEIEHYFRENNIPAYLISQYKDTSLEGIETVNSDYEEVDYTTYLLITKSESVLYDTLGAENEKDFNKKIEINLNLLTKAGVTIIKNKDKVKETMINTYNSDIEIDSLNDY